MPELLKKLIRKREPVFQIKRKGGHSLMRLISSKPVGGIPERKNRERAPLTVGRNFTAKSSGDRSGRRDGKERLCLRHKTHTETGGVILGE